MASEFCTSDEPVTLMGTPSGGTFDGPGVMPVLVGCETEIWINEFHYDNDGPDQDEFIEVAGIAGTVLDGYTIVLYNGTDPYSSGSIIPLFGTIDDEMFSGFGAVSFLVPGLQNGDADGFVLLDPSNDVIEFLSYEGTITATSGPAMGLTSTDVGFAESGSTPIGASIGLIGSGNMSSDFTWTAPLPFTPGDINVGQTFFCTNFGFAFDPAEAGVGMHTISYTIVDGNNCTSIATQTVTVIQGPEAGEPITDFEFDENMVPDFCLNQAPIDLTALLIGEDPGGEFAIVSGPSGADITEGILDVSGVDGGNASVVGFEITYTVSGAGTCPDDVTSIFIYFEVVPTVGTIMGTAFICEDNGPFDLDDLLPADATMGGTWTLLTTNVNIAIMNGDTIEPDSVLFLPPGSTVPNSRIVEFRYEVEGVSGSLCPNATADFTLQINQAARAEVTTTAVNNTICYDDVAEVTATLMDAATDGTWTIVEGAGTFTGEMATSTNLSEVYTPAEADYGTTVTLRFTTNDPDGPAGTGTFPYIENPCEPAVVDIEIIVLDEPVAEPTPAEETICSGDIPSVVVNSSTLQEVRFLVEAVASLDSITGFTETQLALAVGELLDSNAITNDTTVVGTVTYTITPYDAGPDGEFDTADDCVGTDTTVVITVEPEPLVGLTVTIDEVDQPQVTADNTPQTYTVCSGAVISAVGDDFDVMPSGTSQVYGFVQISDTADLLGLLPATELYAPLSDVTFGGSA
ncbi:MAG: hypothetical protein AAFU67_10370, partial [Bacteroidota bacterium]